MKSRELWWHEYKRKKIRQRRKMKIKIAVRNIFKRCFIDYVKNSSLTSLNQMSNSNTTMIQRIVSFLVFGAMCAIGVYFLWYLWFGRLSSPLIVTTDNPVYPIAKIDFPAVAICNINIISKKALIEFELNVFKRNVSDNLRDSHTWQFGRLLDYYYDARMEDILEENPENDFYKFAPAIIRTMKGLAPKCEDMLLACMWGGELVNCRSIFQSRRTSRGYCCTFNYVREFRNAGTPSKLIAEVKRQQNSGSFYGLNLIIDPLIDDYAYTTRATQGVETLVFDPTHYADPNSGRVMVRLAEPNQSLHLNLRSYTQVATPEVRKYGADTRMCLFHDDRKEFYKDMYSYSACIFNCRLKSIQMLCGCTPYTFPTLTKVPTCTLNDISCLNKYKDKFKLLYPFGSEDEKSLYKELHDSLYCPGCMPDCEYTKHVTKAYKIPFLPHSTMEDNIFRFFNVDINMTNKCYVSIFQSTAYGTLDRLDVVKYWYEVISDIGSVLEILIGSSIISVFEIVYFFVFKVLILVLKLFFKRYHK